MPPALAACLEQDGVTHAVSMARYLVVLRPRDPVAPRELIAGLLPLMEQLEAEVDHRTPAHLSALLKGGSDNLSLQLFADVQSKAGGPVLELVLISRESMGKGSPQTRERLEDLVRKAAAAMPQLELVFRSDRDGPVAHVG